MNQSIISTCRIAAIALSMAACTVGCTDQSDGTDPASTGLIPLDVTAEIEGNATSSASLSDRGITRASSDLVNAPKEKFVSGDILGLSYSNDHSNNIDSDELLKANATCSGSAWTISPAAYVDYPSPNMVMAAYPSPETLQESGFDAYGVKFSTDNEQNDVLECVDFLEGEGTPAITEGGKKAKVSFSMTHRHALLNIAVNVKTADDGKSQQESIDKLIFKVKFVPKTGDAVTYNLEPAEGSAVEGTLGEGTFYHAIVPTLSGEEGTFLLTGIEVTSKTKLYKVDFNGEGKQLASNCLYPLSITIRGEVVYYEFGNAQIGWNEGTTHGGEADQYDLVIKDAAELLMFAQDVNNNNTIKSLNGQEIYAPQAKVLQTADIDLNTYSTWTFIGNETNPFKGSYNGNGFIIKNMTISDSQTSQYLGLFGKTRGAVLTGIHLRNVKIKCTDSNADKKPYIGSLVGYSTDNWITSTNTCISLCSAQGSIEVNSTNYSECHVGGLIGKSEATDLTRCSTDVTILTETGNTATSVGGLTGSIGINSSYKQIVSCYTKGAITIKGASEIHAGGLIGYASSKPGALYACYTKADINIENAKTGTMMYIGGLIGRSVYKILGCYSWNNITITCLQNAPLYVGHLIGYRYDPPTDQVQHCYGADRITVTQGSSPTTVTPNDASLASTTIVFNSSPTGSSLYDIVSATTACSNVSTTSYDSQKQPCYQINIETKQWESSSAWKSLGQNQIYPTLDMNYNGETTN